jgi:hypothetical protein
VAPYSREYNTYRQKVGAETKDNTELRIEYEKILDRVRQTRESVIKMDDRRFTAPVEEISGTVDEASPGGITLKEYPGRRFQFSSVGLTAADMSARILGENNQMTRALHPAQHKSPRAHTPADRLCTHASPHSQAAPRPPCPPSMSHHALVSAGLPAASLSPVRGAQHVLPHPVRQRVQSMARRVSERSCSTMLLQTRPCPSESAPETRSGLPTRNSPRYFRDAGSEKMPFSPQHRGRCFCQENMVHSVCT